MKNNIKYRYALDELGNVVDVFALTEEDRKDYICLGCERTLRPTLGNVRSRHFRHKAVGDCSLETYLHRMGIVLFQETYQDCLYQNIPFSLETNQEEVCHACQEGPCKSLSPILIDLTVRYPQSGVEKRDQVDTDIFIPDIMLYDDNGDKVYVEIVVSHKSEPKKLDSAIPIIEISLSDESDLEVIPERLLKESDFRVELINFSLVQVQVDKSSYCEKFRSRQDAEELDREVKKSFSAYFHRAVEEKSPVYIPLEHPLICEFCPGGPCPVGSQVELMDLTRHFQVIVEEPPGPNEVNNRLAVVSKSGRKLYFESRGVFQRRDNVEEFLQSGIELIEFSGSNNKPIDTIWERDVWQNGLTLHNISPKPIRSDDPVNCIQRTHFLFIYRTGRARIDWLSRIAYEKQKRKSAVVYSKEVEGEEHDIFINELELAFSQGIKVKNCYLCRYHAGSDNRFHYEEKRGAVFCKFLKKNFGSNQAADCEYYKPDSNVFGTERYQFQSKIW